MSEINTRAWHICLPCGKELHGRDVGSFAKVKHRKILDLWVETGAGKVYAERNVQRPPAGFDFYIHVAMEEGGKIEKHWKLITLYKDRKIIKHVLLDGRNWMEVQAPVPVE